MQSMSPKIKLVTVVSHFCYLLYSYMSVIHMMNDVFEELMSSRTTMYASLCFRNVYF